MKKPRTNKAAIAELLGSVNVETRTTAEIECMVCGEALSDDCDAKDLARFAHAQGWKHLESEKYGAIGAVCRSCIKQKDF